MPPPKETVDVLAENLRAHMRRLAMSERAVAEAAKIDPKTVNNMLNGRNYPQLDKVEAVAKALGLQTWQLLVTGMAAAVIAGSGLGAVIEAWGRTDDSGREMIQRVAQMVPKTPK